MSSRAGYAQNYRIESQNKVANRNGIRELRPVRTRALRKPPDTARRNARPPLVAGRDDERALRDLPYIPVQHRLEELLTSRNVRGYLPLLKHVLLKGFEGGGSFRDLKTDTALP